MDTGTVRSRLRPRFVRAADLAALRSAGRLTAHLDGHTVALFAAGDAIYAVDNRCPHMGFPLDRGTVQDGILTCHWHHARFDLASGGTFDQFAGDVRAYPVEVRGDGVYVDLAPPDDPRAYHRERLRDGLERNIPLVIAKAVLGLTDPLDGDAAGAVRAGLEFGTRYRQAGWGPGLTILVCLANLLPYLDAEDRPRALYQGLSAVARDSDGMPPRFDLRPLPGAPADIATLARWFRRFIEVRDAEGAERCVVTAVQTGADAPALARLLFAAATDHRYIQIGHPLDFTNKALEGLDHVGWDLAAPVLASLAAGYAGADRMEESNAWRHPIDLVAVLEEAFEHLPAALEAGRRARPQREAADAALPATPPRANMTLTPADFAAGRPAAGHDETIAGQHDINAAGSGEAALVRILLGEDPGAIAEALLGTLREGTAAASLAGTVAYAAALRIAQFPPTNEFGDWDTALHTFTFANAVHQGLRRAPSDDLLRGVFDAAMSVYLDRFLNVPPVRLPEPDVSRPDPAGLLRGLPDVFNRQQQISEAAQAVAAYLSGGGMAERLTAALGHLLLREDRNFHTIQMVEAAVRQHALLRGRPEAAHILVAAARYLAAHAPTVRSEEQTYQIASRLHHGDRLFEEA